MMCSRAYLRGNSATPRNRIESIYTHRIETREAHASKTAARHAFRARDEVKVEDMWGEENGGEGEMAKPNKHSPAAGGRLNY